MRTSCRVGSPQEATKSREQRRAARRIHADLAAPGYEGSYARGAAFIRSWKAERQAAHQTTGRGVFVPLSFAPGEASQFDCSEDRAAIGGRRVKLQVAHMKLSHRRAFVIRAYPLQTHDRRDTCPRAREPDAHGAVFRWFRGTTKRVSPTCLVHFESNRYSVPASFANRPVGLRVYPEQIAVVAEGQVLCTHGRIIERSHGVSGRTSL